MLRKAKSEVLNLLIEKNPNYVSELSIKNRIKKFDSDVIDSAISALLESGEIDKKIDERKISGNPVSFYCIKDKSRYPIRETIRVGDVEVPRLISDSQIGLFPEILNEQLEHLADYTRNLEKRFLEIIQKEQRKYWANVLGIFGALLSILALVLVGLPKIQTDPSLSFWQVVEYNFAQLLPIAIVLALFAIVLRLIIR